MRRLMFRGPGQLRWEEGPAPALSDARDAIVRPIAVARCDLDPAIVTGLYPMAPPFCMGHEMVGEIVDRGDEAGPYEVGRKVIVPFQISCGRCPMCRRGLTNACEAVPPGSAFGLGPHDGIDYGGALADLVRVPFADAMLLALPDGMDPALAAGVPDNIADGYRCVAGPLEEWPRAEVLVVGGLAQSVGLYAVAAAIALGASRVRYVDQDPRRLEIAASLGAEVRNVSLEELTPSDQFAVTVDACVLDQGRTFALRSTQPCGTCTSVSGGATTTAVLPLQSMYLKGIRYEIGRVHAAATASPVLDLLTSGRLDPRPVTTAVLPFADAADAMTDPTVKVVFLNEHQAVLSTSS